MARKKRPRVYGKILKYIRSRLGHSTEPGVSMHVLACRALEKDGYPRPADLTPRAWSNKNLHVILAFHEALNRKEVEQASTNPKSEVDPASDAFLMSFSWRKLRMQAIQRYGARCMCCGATPRDGIVINVDHIKPRKNYPHLALDIDNLQILCNPCNHGKGNWDETDWRG